MLPFCIFTMGDHKHKSKESKKKSKKEHKKHKKHKKEESSSEPEIDYNDPSLWVEKDQPEPAPPPSQSSAPRHEWMLNESFDFGSLGVAREKPENTPKPDPDQVGTK